jgi:hypothetical protein
LRTKPFHLFNQYKTFTTISENVYQQSKDIVKEIENGEHNLMEEKLRKHTYTCILKMKKSFVDSENKPRNGREREKSV